MADKFQENLTRFTIAFGAKTFLFSLYKVQNSFCVWVFFNGQFTNEASRLCQQKVQKQQLSRVQGQKIYRRFQLENCEAVDRGGHQFDPC